MSPLQIGFDFNKYHFIFLNQAPKVPLPKQTTVNPKWPLPTKNGTRTMPHLKTAMRKWGWIMMIIPVFQKPAALRRTLASALLLCRFAPGADPRARPLRRRPLLRPDFVHPVPPAPSQLHPPPRRMEAYLPRRRRVPARMGPPPGPVLRGTVPAAWRHLLLVVQTSGSSSGSAKCA